MLGVGLLVMILTGALHIL